MGATRHICPVTPCHSLSLPFTPHVDERSEKNINEVKGSERTIQFDDNKERQQYDDNELYNSGDIGSDKCICPVTPCHSFSLLFTPQR